MPQQDPFAQYAVKSAANDDDPFAAYAAKPAGPRRPVSAEDFMTPEEIANRDMTGADLGIGALKGIGRSVIGIGKMAAMGGNIPGVQPGVEHPIFARADEALKTSNPAQDVGGYMETAAEVALPVLRGAKMLRAAAPTARQAVGVAARGLAKSDQPVLTQLRRAVMGKVLNPVINWADEAAPAAAAAAEQVAKPAAGRLVGARVSAEQEIADALGKASEAGSRAARAIRPAQRTTLPPEPSLRPGYAPRTTAPKPKPAPSTSHGARDYFLKADAARPAPTPKQGSVGLDDLPASWKPMTAPPTIPSRDIGGSELAGAYAQELTRRGVRPAAALKQVRNDPDIPPDVKTKIMAALSKVAKNQ